MGWCCLCGQESILCGHEEVFSSEDMNTLTKDESNSIDMLKPVG